ncbi:DsbA family protein [Pseudodesulfovibrio indicus]|jgi:hypothetical protein|uniref:Thioredoxin-like fold domain-containing protein n=1 Tax=Pseudodesulfovibrio indicus TaxID=1716143 RepID=A0AA94PPU4_9BACT|nr:hypothetical protein [Pseudodesulfovibrio indicus]TDT92283.1 hypothetical protein EDC59_101689 [Pseudodesulfovibrio indicus]
MRALLIISFLSLTMLFPPQSYAADEDGCAPKFLTLTESARVELKGKGDFDIVVATDPLCGHCRLGHKLLKEYPEKYRSLKLLFYPRQSFIGSDMAAWILEDFVGSDRLETMVDFAYSDLKQPKTKDLNEARMGVLMQFTEEFPSLLANTTLPKLFVKLGRTHRERVLKGASLAKAAGLPGTPVLLAGENIVMGYGPQHWLTALDKKAICK